MRVSSPCPFHALHSLSLKRTVTGDAEVSCWPSVISTHSPWQVEQLQHRDSEGQVESLHRSCDFYGVVTFRGTQPLMNRSRKFAAKICSGFTGQICGQMLERAERRMKKRGFCPANFHSNIRGQTAFIRYQGSARMTQVTAAASFPGQLWPSAL
jgi:hypothetical protein